MPTPLEILLDPISLVVLATFAGLALLEALFPARPLPAVRGWRARGLISFAVFFFASSYLPMFWDQHLAPYRVFDLTGWGTAGGAVAGILVYELGLYAWHRALHRSNLLWRTFHQMHHSAERVDTAGAFYFSPLDIVGLTLLVSLALVVVVGVTPEAAAVTILATNFLGIFQHANLRTPRWLGYLVQRPESHAVHHARGVHRFNYSDLPVFDILGRTFRNPARAPSEAGFYLGASARVLEMLAFKDVSEPNATGSSMGTSPARS